MLDNPYEPANLAQSPLLRECAQCGTRQQSVCSAVEDEDLARLAIHARHVIVPPGQGFIFQDEPAEAFFVVTDGHARLSTLMADGRRQVTGFARRAAFLGLAAQDFYGFGAEAITEMRLCRFSHSSMRLLTEQFPDLGRRLLDEASRELALAQNHMLLLGRKTAAERLASFLITFGAGCDRADLVNLPMSRTDIADYLGLTIETVSRSFNLLRSEGLIAISRVTQIRILDRPGLQARAAGSL